MVPGRATRLEDGVFALLSLGSCRCRAALFFRKGLVLSKGFFRAGLFFSKGTGSCTLHVRFEACPIAVLRKHVFETGQHVRDSVEQKGPFRGISAHRGRNLRRRREGKGVPARHLFRNRIAEIALPKSPRHQSHRVRRDGGWPPDHAFATQQRSNPSRTGQGHLDTNQGTRRHNPYHDLARDPPSETRARLRRPCGPCRPIEWPFGGGPAAVGPECGSRFFIIFFFKKSFFKKSF